MISTAHDKEKVIIKIWCSETVKFFTLRSTSLSDAIKKKVPSSTAHPSYDYWNYLKGNWSYSCHMEIYIIIETARDIASLVWLDQKYMIALLKIVHSLTYFLSFMVITEIAVTHDELAAHRAVFLAARAKKGLVQNVWHLIRLFEPKWALTSFLCTGRCSTCKTCAGSCLQTWARSRYRCRSSRAVNFPWSSRRGQGWSTHRPPWCQACVAWAFTRRSRHLNRQHEIIIKYKPFWGAFWQNCWRLNLLDICCWRI